MSPREERPEPQWKAGSMSQCERTPASQIGTASAVTSFFPGETVSLGEAEACARDWLSERGIADAAIDARYLLEYVTGMSRASFLAERKKRMQEEQRDAYAELITRRGSHIPLQYLTGEQEFMGLSFLVGPQVLIPRQDTETLVEEALAQMAQRCGNSCRVLDLCTGSGCIAVSLAKLGRTADGQSPEVWASDLSEDALHVAKRNADRLEAAVHFVQSDLFARIPEQFDMIVSNPPYICTGVIETLDQEVRQHEPRTALDGGADGLDFYRRIIRESAAHLHKQGSLLFEIGWDQGEAVSGLLQESGFDSVCVKKDLAGQDRVVMAKRK